MVLARTNIRRVMKKLLFTYLFLIMLSCSEAGLVELQTEQEYIDVPVSLSVEECVTVGPATKSDGASSVNEEIIKNLWILQYEGKTDEAKLVGNQIYLDYSEDQEDLQNVTVSLVATPEGTPTTVVFIGNTFDRNFSGINTLGEIKSRIRSVTQKNPALIVDEEGNEHVIFSAFSEITTGLQPGSRIEAELKRNLAKVEFEVKNSLPENIIISSVQLCSVPNVSYYLVDPQADSFPSEKVATFIDMEKVEWTSGKTSDSFLYYLPVNLRGRIENASEQSKNRHAPFNATYLKVVGTYSKGNKNYPVCYKFYLGKNMYDDFNLEPNHHYTYTFDIASVDYSEDDSRVEQWEMVDFSDASYESSNCYVLNPGTQPRLFRIPIQQIKTFWGSERKAIYEDDPYYALRGNAEWKAWVIASDFKLTDKFEITDGEGTSDGQPYFDVTVAPSTPGNVIAGNVIVAVGPKEGNDNNDKISWSWHLWITDYNPYACMDFGNGLDGTYIYPVENGDVHRYEGLYWTYNKDHYIMDRNIGAYSADYPEDGKTGILYYQFGRKDPFFYFKATTSQYVVGKIELVENGVANTETHNAQIYSIHKPLNFVKGFVEAGVKEHNNGPWISGNKYNPDKYDSSLAWHDPQTVRGGVREGEKSIFDPCPPGFKVPESSIWSDFRPNDRDDRTTNAFIGQPASMKQGFRSTLDAKGLQYWPYQSDADIPQKVIFYPVTGLILSTYKAVQQVFGLNPISVYAWASYVNSSNLANGTGLSSQARTDGKEYSLYVNLSTSQSRGLPVRCITDK